MREAIEHFNRRDVAAAGGYLHPNVEWEFSGNFLQDEGNFVRGRDELLGFAKLMFDAFPTTNVEIDETVELPNDKVVAVGQIEIARGDSDPVAVPWVRLFELEDGMIRRFTVHESLEAAEAAAGASQ